MISIFFDVASFFSRAGDTWDRFVTHRRITYRDVITFRVVRDKGATRGLFQTERLIDIDTATYSSDSPVPKSDTPPRVYPFENVKLGMELIFGPPTFANSSLVPLVVYAVSFILP